MQPGAMPELHLINQCKNWFHVSCKGTSFTGEDCKVCLKLMAPNCC